MSLLEVLMFPDDRLRHKAEAVSVERIATPKFQKLVDDMAETMYAHRGVGLAAPQVGVGLRLFVIDIAGDDRPSDLRVFVNPEIYEFGLDNAPWDEGCLSFAGITEIVERPKRVRVRALGRDGLPFDGEVRGLLAVAIQHETEHLDGVLFIDKMSGMKREMMLKKLGKLRG